jgi:predicted ATPase/transcriptional regulator with XRE-family HTH domain
MSFAEQLRHYRERAGLTQEELAAKAGLTAKAISALERAERRSPYPHTVRALADALGLSQAERAELLQARIGSKQAAVPAAPPLAPPAGSPADRLPEVRLPVYFTPFIGREQEQANLLRLLAAPQYRLMTLLGPGGIGKTRLAVEVARQTAHFTDGVMFVPLSAVGDPAEVVPTIAEALGLSLNGNSELIAQLLAYLQDKSLLLVLDNMEHLLDHGRITIELVRQILVQAPAVKLLATSRERLRIDAEWVVEPGGLALPTTSAQRQSDRADAVRLFADRAQHLDPHFAIDDGNRASIVQICRRLEGLPLAIELAAGWTGVLTLPEIAAEIDRGLDFLSQDHHDSPDRHRSLRAALDHSWRLLDRAEQRAVAQLSIFQGGCDREAIQEVIDATLPLLTALIDKSLVQRAKLRGVTRYTLHELVRQYAAERLIADPEDYQATARRHSAFYAQLLQRSIAAQTGSLSVEAWSHLNRNIDNVRAAWLRAASGGDSATVLAMARGLMILYDIPGWVIEGAALFERASNALRAAGAQAEAGLGMTLGFQGYFLQLKHPAAGARVLEEAVALLERAGNTSACAQFLLPLGTIQIAGARFAAAQACYAQASQLARSSGDQLTLLWALFYEGVIALYTGDLAAAEQRFGAGLDAWRSQDFKRGIAWALNWLSEVARQQGRLEAANAFASEGLQVSSTAHDTPGIARALRELGALALVRQDADEAAYLLAESCATFRSIGHPWVYGRSLSLLIQLDIQQQRIAAARQGCAELLRLIDAGAVIMLPEVAYNVALLLVAKGQPEQALAILTLLDNTPGEAATLALAARLQTDLAQQLPSAQVAHAAELARSHTLLPWLRELSAL